MLWSQFWFNLIIVSTVGSIVLMGAVKRNATMTKQGLATFGHWAVLLFQDYLGLWVVWLFQDYLGHPSFTNCVSRVASQRKPSSTTWRCMPLHQCSDCCTTLTHKRTQWPRTVGGLKVECHLVLVSCRTYHFTISSDTLIAEWFDLGDHQIPYSYLYHFTDCGTLMLKQLWDLGGLNVTQH